EFRVTLSSAQSHSEAKGKSRTLVAQIYDFVTDCSSHSLRELLGQREVATGGDDQEFLAAVASNNVIGTERRRNALHYGNQHRIPSAMAVSVIDLLEMINISENY